MKINNHKDLKQAIAALEQKKLQQQEMLIQQLHVTYQGLKPTNLLKEGFDKLLQNSGAVTSGAVKTAAGIGIGMLTKKFFFGKHSSIATKLAGTALDLFLTKKAVDNTDTIKAYGTAVYNNLFKKNPRGKSESNGTHELLKPE